MPKHFISSSKVKLSLMQQFYGLEEYLDLNEPLPEMLNKLDYKTSEFCFITALSNLDLWFIRITNHDKSEVWSPFKERLTKFAKRHDLITAHMFADKQWTNSEILRYLGLPDQNE